MAAVGGRLDDDAAAEMKPARRVRMASSCGVNVMVVVLFLCSTDSDRQRRADTDIFVRCKMDRFLHFEL